MTKPKMFPAKSRLQVAICLEKLLNAHLDTSDLVTFHLGHSSDGQHHIAAYLSQLCATRIIGLIRPCVHEHLAPYYKPTDRLVTKSNRAAVMAVRGWRKRHPRLLDPIRKA